MISGVVQSRNGLWCAVISICSSYDIEYIDLIKTVVNCLQDFVWFYFFMFSSYWPQNKIKMNRLHNMILDFNRKVIRKKIFNMLSWSIV